MTPSGFSLLSGFPRWHFDAGFWKNQEELKRLRTTDRMFLPNPVRGEYRPLLQNWENALQRSLHWQGALYTNRHHTAGGEAHRTRPGPPYYPPRFAW
ncbi:hypothetical protein JZ751_013801 [Albula glossodonta]|uniref:Uncharacterized protein n=1 Tax=Albula glossodonta TaxID=121402 RepID=A0A8T2NWZ1_9TELE|nr:hypothetical protein JZ751_013801 [Albula glossodonta]